MYFESEIRKFMEILHKKQEEIAEAMINNCGDSQHIVVLYARKQALAKLSSYCSAAISKEQWFREEYRKIDTGEELF